MTLDLTKVRYNELAYVKFGASGDNIADHCQAFGGVSEGLVTQPISTVNQKNTMMTGRQVSRVLTLTLHGTDDIIEFFRGTDNAGILGDEIDVTFQYTHEASDPPGTAAPATPLVVCSDCLVAGPGRFPGGPVEASQLFIVNWHINGTVEIKTS